MGGKRGKGAEPEAARNWPNKILNGRTCVSTGGTGFFFSNIFFLFQKRERERERKRGFSPLFQLPATSKKKKPKNQNRNRKIKKKERDDKRARE